MSSNGRSRLIWSFLLGCAFSVTLVASLSQPILIPSTVTSGLLIGYLLLR